MILKSANILTFICVCTALHNMVNYVVYADQSTLKLQGNVYSEFLVAIHRDVEENETMITNLQDYIRDMSSALFTATEGRAFLGNVSILVPSTWSTSSQYQPASKQTIDGAHFKVDPHNETWGIVPYTEKKQASCGSPGDRTVLSPEFLLNRDAAERIVGPIGKTLVHEFAHLRWGLLDEFPGEGQYTPCDDIYDNGPKTCAKNLKVNNIAKVQCILLPDLQSVGNASLMYMAYHPKVTAFCDNDTHEFDFLNDQNKVCELSGWELLRRHADFKDGANPPTTIYKPPSFHVIQVMPIRNMIVLDVSASVAEDGKMDAIQTQVSRYITGDALNNSLLGLVEFSYSFATKVTVPLTKLDTRATRESIAAKLPVTSAGSTCIKCGVQKALTELESHGSAAGAVITVLSDGRENIRRVTDLIPDLVSKGAVVDSILYGAERELHLKHVSEATGGYVRVVPVAADLHLALVDLMRKRAEDASDLPTQTTSDDVTVSPDSETTGSIAVDTAVTDGTLFTFTWPPPELELEVTLTMPNQSTITAASPYYMYEKKWNSVKVELPVAEVGLWTYSIKNKDTDRKIVAKVSVQGRSPNQISGISVTSSVGSTDLNLTANQQRFMTIYAIVRQEDKPVVGCVVRAEVTSDVSSLFIRLLDNGAGVDSLKDDGTYSAHFTNFTKDGFYNVNVYATFDGKTTKIKRVSRSFGLGSSVQRYYEIDKTETYENVEPGSRVSNGGAFYVTGSDAYNASFPPNKVTDLRIQILGDARGEAILRWTAVGNDLDQGTAAAYEIRYSNDVTKLRTAFSTADLITEKVANISLPSPAGTEEVLTLNLTKPGRFGIAIVTIDDQGNRAPVSNVVYLIVKQLNIYTNTSNSPSDTTVLSTARDDHNSTSVVGSTETTLRLSSTTDRDVKPSNSSNVSEATTAGTDSGSPTSSPASRVTDTTSQTIGLSTSSSVPVERPSGLTTSEIIGIIVGACVFIISLSVIVFCVVSKSKDKRKPSPYQDMTMHGDYEAQYEEISSDRNSKTLQNMPYQNPVFVHDDYEKMNISWQNTAKQQMNAYDVIEHKQTTSIRVSAQTNTKMAVNNSRVREIPVVEMQRDNYLYMNHSQYYQ